MGMTWHDSRLRQPRCNGYGKYLVIYSHRDKPLESPKLRPHLAIDCFEWIPERSYTWGHWQDPGNNHYTPEVLYWTELPKIPKWMEE